MSGGVLGSRNRGGRPGGVLLVHQEDTTRTTTRGAEIVAVVLVVSSWCGAPVVLLAGTDFIYWSYSSLVVLWMH